MEAAAQRRRGGLDILKGICAFLIVCIHAPFPGVAGEYFTSLTRMAVPVFFMITGYFYNNVRNRGRVRDQLIKAAGKVISLLNNGAVTGAYNAVRPVLIYAGAALAACIYFEVIKRISTDTVNK